MLRAGNAGPCHSSVSTNIDALIVNALWHPTTGHQLPCFRPSGERGRWPERCGLGGIDSRCTLWAYCCVLALRAPAYGGIPGSAPVNPARRIVALAALTLPVAALAQDGHLTLPDFSALAARASEHTDISLGAGLLHFASHFFDDKDPDAAATRRFMAGLRGIEEHSYKFSSHPAYSARGTDSARRQLRLPRWKRL